MWVLKIKDRVICTFDTEQEAISAHLACIRAIGILGDKAYQSTCFNDEVLRETTNMVIDMHVEMMQDRPSGE